MGRYLNSGNRGFRTILNGTYVDKTGLIEYVNSTIDTPQKFTLSSRPRRFGKTFAAKMLCAYYDKSCDSRSLFDGLEISKKDSFDKYINKYDVIYLDITSFIPTVDSIKDVVRNIQINVIDELREIYPSYIIDGEKVLADALFAVSHKTGNRFIIIIDEWDALFREAKNDEKIQKEYVRFLRGLFKGGTVTDETIAAAYMTGILPIKKYGTESSLNNFHEYTMTKPANLEKYVGFTEQEVRKLCEEYNMNFEQMRDYYEGYSFHRFKNVYNPYSVMRAVLHGKINDYWAQSETYLSLKNYINMDLEGLKETVMSLIAGDHVSVNVNLFLNDFISFNYKDDIITLLIHLGYLAYDKDKEKAFIPNKEITENFNIAVR